MSDFLSMVFVVAASFCYAIKKNISEGNLSFYGKQFDPRYSWAAGFKGYDPKNGERHFLSTSIFSFWYDREKLFSIFAWFCVHTVMAINWDYVGFVAQENNNLLYGLDLPLRVKSFLYSRNNWLMSMSEVPFYSYLFNLSFIKVMHLFTFNFYYHFFRKEAKKWDDLFVR